MNRTLAIASAAVFVGLVVASNVLTAHYGLVGGFVTAGTFTASLVLAARDAVRETAGLAWAFACVALGAGISYFMTGPALALASGAAFALAGVLDAFVYEPLRARGYFQAVTWSQVVGAVVDSVVFLWLAGFAIWPAAGTQTVVKWLVVLVPLALLEGVRRAVLRNRLRTQGA